MMYLPYLVMSCIIALVQGENSHFNQDPHSLEALSDTFQTMLSTLGTVDKEKNNAFMDAFESVADLGTTLTEVLIKLVQNEGEAEAVINAAENVLIDLKDGVEKLTTQQNINE